MALGTKVLAFAVDKVSVLRAVVYTDVLLGLLDGLLVRLVGLVVVDGTGTVVANLDFFRPLGLRISLRASNQASVMRVVAVAVSPLVG